MKPTNVLPILILFIGLTITSCEFNINKVDKSADKYSSELKEDNIPKKFRISKTELLGKWVQTGTTEIQRKKTALHIMSINFKEDLKADMLLSDSLGTRTVIGDWDNKDSEYSMKIGDNLGGDVKLTFGVLLKYFRDSQRMNIITLTEELNNGKILLKSPGGVIFEKE
ncbi:hypothetical protein [uncultured Kriegella sp.]|uniref:hypothetical protein n=1 Tax=uncultured Kriegella sp. TaxID=1798910 RepID=UPI0030DCEA18|tara:strand:+ start:20211 stop:20714 length:504 start_codon:yes stop_codon:yes gene_type:complete